MAFHAEDDPKRHFGGGGRSRDMDVEVEGILDIRPLLAEKIYLNLPKNFF